MAGGLTSTPTEAHRSGLAGLFAEAMRKGGALTHSNGEINVEETAMEMLLGVATLTRTVCPIEYGGLSALLKVMNYYWMHAETAEAQVVARKGQEALTVLLEMYNAALMEWEELRGVTAAAFAYEAEVCGAPEDYSL